MERRNVQNATQLTPAKTVIAATLQNYRCQNCGRQFVESYSPQGYSKEVKQHCLTLYVNGLGFRAIEP